MLTAIVLTLNEQEHLPDCLASLRWTDELVVFDSFSSDRTLEIARRAGARVHQRAFDNYAAQRNAALAACPQAEWVLFVDADERVPPALAEEIRAVMQQGRAAAGWIPRHNYIFGRLTLHAGWYPDYQLRLLRPDRARYDPERPVHELALVDGPEVHLSRPMVHLNYASVHEFVARQRTYAEYDAQILYRHGQRARPWNYVLQPLRQFWWRYVTLHGWREGLHGLRLSVLMAYFQFVLYRRLASLARRGGQA
ncbi:MAG: glycosyltransferase family 2 protein [Chloroflexi bacterium]|nr:glycosyltransferase family 2 protein [Chloroflexota bacterium]